MRPASKTMVVLERVGRGKDVPSTRSLQSHPHTHKPLSIATELADSTLTMKAAKQPDQLGGNVAGGPWVCQPHKKGSSWAQSFCQATFNLGHKNEKVPLFKTFLKFLIGMIYVNKMLN